MKNYIFYRNLKQVLILIVEDNYLSSSLELEKFFFLILDGIKVYISISKSLVPLHLTLLKPRSISALRKCTQFHVSYQMKSNVLLHTSRYAFSKFETVSPKRSGKGEGIEYFWYIVVW